MFRIIILSILFLPSSFAQIVNIVDENNSPIAGASFYTSGNVFVSSDDLGNVNLDNCEYMKNKSINLPIRENLKLNEIKYIVKTMNNFE